MVTFLQTSAPCQGDIKSWKVKDPHFITRGYPITMKHREFYPIPTPSLLSMGGRTSQHGPLVTRTLPTE